MTEHWDPAIAELERRPKPPEQKLTGRDRRERDAAAEVYEKYPELMRSLDQSTELEARRGRLMPPEDLTGPDALLYRAGQRSVYLLFKRSAEAVKHGR